MVEKIRPAAPDRLIEIPEVSYITSLKKTKIYEHINLGELKPIKLGKKTVFSHAEIIAWVENKIATRNTLQNVGVGK